MQLRDTANENPGRAAAMRCRDGDAGAGGGHRRRARSTPSATARCCARASSSASAASGTSYDGFYYVRRVTHTIRHGTYTQSFTLSREGTGALLPVVVP